MYFDIMFSKGVYFYLLAITSLTGAVKVNMQGSFSLGKEVMDTISYYLRSGYRPFLSSRRSNTNFDPIPDYPIEVKTAKLCNNLEICTGNLDKFVNEYVTALASGVEGVFEGFINEKFESDSDKNVSIFQKLNGCLTHARKFLKKANEKAAEEKEKSVWVDVIKKTSSYFQKKSITYITGKLDVVAEDLNEVKKKLTQHLVISIATNEAKAQKKLCYEHQICSRSIECTSALSIVLNRLKTIPYSRLKEFLQAFYEVLPETAFYSLLTDATANEFQVILNDMAFSDNVPAKEIFDSLHETLELRLKTMYTSTEPTEGQDIQLVHVILSDMDYLYSKRKAKPFHVFFKKFYKWASEGGVIAPDLKDVVKNIEATLTSAPDELVLKLSNEARVFLEITIDP